MNNEIYSKAKEILIFLGFKSSKYLNIKYFNMLKQDIISTYNIRFDENISENQPLLAKARLIICLNLFLS